MNWSRQAGWVGLFDRYLILGAVVKLYTFLYQGT